MTLVQILVGVAAAIYIWKAFKSWRMDRFAKKTMQPYGGLDHDVRK